MVGALGILLVLVVGFVLLRDLDRNDPEPPAQAVDYQQSAQYAADQAPFAVLAPPELPAGWRATSVGYTPEPPRWHLGLLNDTGDYVGLEQATDSAESLVSTYVDDEATRDEQVRIDGELWAAWTDVEGDRALVREGDRVTTLVVGPVEQDVLVDYVRLLR